MHNELYLDTARLGRMCRGARSAEQDFCWLVSQLGSSLYLERFLSHGFSSLPCRVRRQVPGLRCWHGLQQLGESLGEFVRQPDELPNYLFGQSSELIRFAAESLFSRSQRVLITDLCWPPYADVLQQVAKELDRKLTVVALKSLVTSDVATSDDVAERLIQAYRAEQCDGLFLSDISFLGVALPVERLLTELTPRFAIIDGAQAFHQRSVDLSKLPCDLYLAGTQKWFGAYHPLRMAFVGRSDNLSTLTAGVQTHLASHYADSLFRFYEEAKTSNFPPFGTTVNVSPLICAAGALKHAQRQIQIYEKWNVLRANAESFAEWVTDSHWRPMKLHDSLRSGIVRLLPNRRASQYVGGQLRQALARNGVVATAYDDGVLRFSMPRSYLWLSQLSEVIRALRLTWR